MQMMLMLCYPLLMHTAVLIEQPNLKILALIFLAGGIFYRHLLARNLMVMLVFCGLVGIFLIASQFSLGRYILYIPPVVIPLIFGTVFFRSLLPGQIPLVTDIGEKSRGPLSEEMRNYTRKVTIMWALFFALLITMAILLPWLASETIWSLFTNIINYLIVGVLFLGEFIYRKIKFPEHDHPFFFQYINIVINADTRRS